jgi:hypothetical protein
VISARTGRPAASPIPVGHRPTAIAINPVADRAYVTGIGPGTLSMIDPKRNEMVVGTIEVGPFPLAIAVSLGLVFGTIAGEAELFEKRAKAYCSTCARSRDSARRRGASDLGGSLYQRDATASSSGDANR